MPLDPADRAIASMRSPRDMHIICIDVTNKCDLKCSNCTRLLANQTVLWDMTPDNFRLALRSLKNFKGVIAMIGGNPCMHKEFPELCRIFVEEVPEARQRGLWSNNVFKFQELIRDTFGFFNLNPHNDERGIKSLEKLKELIPTIEFYRGNSQHAPLLTGMKDLYPDQETMWSRIATCDINREWSATIVQNKGELRAYFCEVAASFDLARGTDNGLPVTEDWWNRALGDFSDQVKRFCPGCGVPARLEGTLDSAEIDSFTSCNADIVKPVGRRRARKTIEMTEPAEIRAVDRHVTDYNEVHLHSAPTPASAIVQTPAPAPTISVIIPFFNSNETLRETVLSVTNQAGPSREVIIVDDLSQQNPADVLGGIEGRILVLRNEVNKGPAASRNAGLMRASGRFVCFLDSDDQYAAGFFAEAMRFFEANPDVSAITTGVELDNCHRYVTQYHHACLTNSIPSNLIMRTDAARLIGGFPEDQAFRGPAAGEDVCFKASLSRLITHHAPFPFLRYRVRQGSHFDRFLDNLQLRDGALIPTAPTPGELDGSINQAMRAHHAQVGARLAAEAETGGRNYPLRYSGFHLGEDYDGLRAQCDLRAEGGIHPEEGYALAHWAAHGPGQGGVVELGCAQGWATPWLALAARDSGRGKVVAVDPFVQTDAGLQAYLEALQTRGFAGHVDTVRAPSAAAARGRETPIRLLVIGGGSSFMVGEQDLSDWSHHVEVAGAYAFHGVGTRPAVTRLYEAMLNAPALREVFSHRSLRILAAR